MLATAGSGSQLDLKTRTGSRTSSSSAAMRLQTGFPQAIETRLSQGHRTKCVHRTHDSSVATLRHRWRPQTCRRFALGPSAHRRHRGGGRRRARCGLRWTARSRSTPSVSNQVEPMERVHAVSRVPQGDSHHPLHNQHHRVAQLPAPKADPPTEQGATSRTDDSPVTKDSSSFAHPTRAASNGSRTRISMGTRSLHFAIMFENRLPAFEVQLHRESDRPSEPQGDIHEGSWTHRRVSLAHRRDMAVRQRSSVACRRVSLATRRDMAVRQRSSRACRRVSLATRRVSLARRRDTTVRQ